MGNWSLEPLQMKSSPLVIIGRGPLGEEARGQTDHGPMAGCFKVMPALDLAAEPIPLWWTTDFINASPPGYLWKSKGAKFFLGGSGGVGRNRSSDLEEMLEQSDAFCVSCFVVWKLQRIIWHSIFVLRNMCLEEGFWAPAPLDSACKVNGPHGCDIIQSDHQKKATEFNVETSWNGTFMKVWVENKRNMLYYNDTY